METKNYNFVRDQFLGSIKFRLRNFFSFSHRFKTMPSDGSHLGFPITACESSYGNQPACKVLRNYHLTCRSYGRMKNIYS
jgi:hypothetical protein